MTAAGLLLSWFVSTTPGLFTLAALAAAWVTGAAVAAYIKMGTPERPRHKASRPQPPRSWAGKARAARRGPPPARRAPGAWARKRIQALRVWWAFAHRRRHDPPTADRIAMGLQEKLKRMRAEEDDTPTLTQALYHQLPLTGPGAGPGGTPAPGAPGPEGETGDEDGCPPAGLDARAVPAPGPGALLLPAPPPRDGLWERHPLRIDHDEYGPDQTWHEPEPEPEPLPVPPSLTDALTITAAAVKALTLDDYTLALPAYRHTDETDSFTAVAAEWSP